MLPDQFAPTDHRPLELPSQTLIAAMAVDRAIRLANSADMISAIGAHLEVVFGRRSLDIAAVLGNGAQERNRS